MSLSIVPGTFEAFGKRYETEGDLVIAFGFYLIASSMSAETQIELAGTLGTIAYRMGDFELAIRCFALAGANQQNEARTRNFRTVKNLIGALGVSVESAKISANTLGLQPIVEELPVEPTPKNGLCVIVADGADPEENVLLSLSEESGYRGVVFRYGELVRCAPRFNADRFIPVFMAQVDPDLILFRHALLTIRTRDPRVEALVALRERGYPPVVGLYYDMAKPGYQRLARAYAPGFDFMVTIDGHDVPENVAIAEHQRLRGWTPLPASLFRDSDEPRNVDVGFVGRVASHQEERCDCLDGLERAGIDVRVKGQDRGGWLSTPEMADFLRSCKIVVNFSYSPMVSPWDARPTRKALRKETHHVKGRVFEAIACGALLFESANEWTRQYFDPQQHYVEFESLDDLLKKIRYYLKHDSERVGISSAATKYYLKYYTGSIFWKKIEKLIS